MAYLVPWQGVAAIPRIAPKPALGSPAEAADNGRVAALPGAAGVPGVKLPPAVMFANREGSGGCRRIITGHECFARDWQLEEEHQQFAYALQRPNFWVLKEPNLLLNVLMA